MEKWELKKDIGRTENEKFHISGRGGNASGYPLEDDKFVVCSGSRISKDVTDGFSQGYSDIRNKLVSEGIVSNYLFVKDYTFSSSSTAASVVLGRAANGRKEWTLLDGRTYGKHGQFEIDS